MENKLNITKGNWVVVNGNIDNGGANYSIDTEDWNVLGAWYIPDGNPKDNAILAADAGNTYQQCNLLPSKLLRQRNDLLKFANLAVSFCDLIRYPTEKELKQIVLMGKEIIKSIENE